jgi:monoamine oxidase
VDWSRREILTAGAVSALGFFPLIEPQVPKVAIVGAGLAGLTAARELRRSKISYALFEARSAVGGRVRTEKLGSRAIEMGAEFIDSNHRHVLTTARALGLEFRDLRPPSTQDKSSFVIVDGKRRYDEDIEKAVKPINRHVERDFDRIRTQPWNDFGRQLDHTSMAEYVSIIEAEAWAKKFFLLTYEAEYGLDADQQSCLNLFGLFEPDDTASGSWGNADERWTIVGGNQQLPTRMAEGLEIRFDHILSGMRKAGSKIELSFENRKPASFDAVILAIPFSVLRTVDTDGVFSADKSKMIEQLGYGTHSKVQLEVTDWRRAKQDWNGDLLIGPWAGWEGSRFQAGRSGHLTLLAGGARGKGLNRESVLKIVAAMKPLGVTLGANHLFKNWSEERFAKGSYSNYRVGEFVRYAGRESLPEGMIFFAGEHCSKAFRSTMNGAMESGVSAARAVARKLR